MTDQHGHQVIEAEDTVRLKYPQCISDQESETSHGTMMIDCMAWPSRVGYDGHSKACLDKFEETFWELTVLFPSCLDQDIYDFRLCELFFVKILLNMIIQYMD